LSFVARALSPPRLVRGGVASTPYEFTAEIAFGREPIVSTATKREVLFAVRAPAGKRRQVVELEPVRLTATFPRISHIGALRRVARKHRTPHRRRHISPAPAR
jgi:hypothetical protein